MRAGRLTDAVGRLPHDKHLIYGATPVVDFKNDEFQDETFAAEMDAERRGHEEAMKREALLAAGGDNLGSQTQQSVAGGHEGLMALIELATGQHTYKEGEDADDNEDSLDWDVDEELFKFASVEGMHGKTCNICGPEHRVRVFCADVVSNQAFEWGILSVIVVIMVALAIDEPAHRANGEEFSENRATMFWLIDFISTLIFTVEAVLRIIAAGFIQHKSSYLRNGWNVFDFVIVCSAWGAIIYASGQGTKEDESMQILRAFRLLRPLHSLRFFKGIKTMLSALNFAAGQLVTVVLLIAIFFVIFGSFGIELYKGVLTNTCDVEHPFFQTMDLNSTVTCPDTLDCQRYGTTECRVVPDTFHESQERAAANSAVGFDSMPHAVLTLFVMTTLDEWPDIQRAISQSGCKSCGVSWGVLLMMVFFLALLGTNLFIAVITYGYNQVVTREHLCKRRLAEIAQEQDGPSCLTHMEGEVQHVAMKELLSHHGFTIIGVQHSEQQNGPAVASRNASLRDFEASNTLEELSQQEQHLTTTDGGDGLDLTNDGAADVTVVDAKDTTGDGQLDTVVVRTRGGSDLQELSVVMDNPSAWPDVPGLSPACRRLVLSSGFDTAIAIIILSNGIVMAAHHYPMDADFATFQDILDLIFIIIYVFEVIVKVLGLGIIPYFAVPFHKLDFMVVLMSIASLFIPQAKGATASRMVRLILRVVRMLRLLKVVSNVDTVVYLIKALTSSGEKLLNMSFLICFFIVLFATITMHAFGDCNGKGKTMSEHYRSNFFTFYDSLLSNFQIFTGEDWAPIMLSHMEECGKVRVAIFFVLTFFVYNFVLINVFTAIILHNFTVPEDEKYGKQKASYREQKGMEAERNDLAVLEWLADAAQGDAAALQAMRKSLLTLHDLQKQMGSNAQKIFKKCHPMPPADEHRREMLQLEVRYVELKAERELLEIQVTEAGRTLQQAEPGSAARDAALLRVHTARNLLDKTCRDEQESRAKYKQKEELLEGMSQETAEVGPKNLSCGCIPPNNVVRRRLVQITNSLKFDAFMIVFIVISSVCLAWKQDDLPSAIVAIGHMCTAVFCCEAIIKIIALNFVVYLSDGWNVLDLFIVGAAVAELVMPDGSSAGTLKVFRLLRLLRALRFIKHVGSLALLVKVIVGSLSTVLATLAIVLIIYTCFGILGLYLFGGLFYNCQPIADAEPAFCSYKNATVPGFMNATVTTTQVWTCLPSGNATERVCDRVQKMYMDPDNCGLCCEGEGGEHAPYKTQECLDDIKDTVSRLSNSTIEWENPPYHFDDIGNAVKTMFYMSTTEGWVNIMNSGIDVPERIGLPPVFNNNKAYATYFLAFQMIGSAFSMSLFTGVLVNYFAESSGSGVLTKKQQEWVHAKLLVHGAHSFKEAVPDVKWRLLCHKLYTWQHWETVVSAVILFNVAIIMAESYPQRSWLETSETPINIACLIFFTFEIFLGVSATSVQSYARHPWNRFDTIVVICSWAAFSTEFLELDIGVNVQALRATRIIRILTLFKGHKSLKALFAAFVLSVPTVINIGMLMSLIFFIFGVAGMHLYGGMPTGEYLNEFQNFNSTGDTMKLLFEVTTGHDFLYIIHEMKKNYEDDPDAYSDYAFLYFLLFYIAGAFVLINLFVAALLENVQVNLSASRSQIQSAHVNEFKRIWDTRTTFPHVKMSCSDLIKMVENDLDEPLSRVKELDFWHHRLLLELQVGTKKNRNTTVVTFKPALMAMCVLFLSSSCLPYSLQRKRFDDMLRQQQETAQRLISSRFAMWLNMRKENPPDLVMDDGRTIKIDTEEMKRTYKIAVRVFGDLCFALVVRNNKVLSARNQALVEKGLKTGKVKLRMSRVGTTLRIFVQEAAQLKDMDAWGRNDVYVIGSVNGITQRTVTVEDAGAHPRWNVRPMDDYAEGVELRFEKVERVDTLYIRVFDEDFGGTSSDDQIGMVNIDVKKIESQQGPDWQSEKWWVCREETELSEARKEAARVKDDAELRKLIMLSLERSQQEMNTVNPVALETGSAPDPNPHLSPSRLLRQPTPAEVQDAKTFVSSRQYHHRMPIGSRKLAMKALDKDFSIESVFYRALGTAVVRTGIEVCKSPIRGFLRVGDVVMVDASTPGENSGPVAFTEEDVERHRMKIKRVSAGKLKLAHVLQGWVSLETVNNVSLFEHFDLFGAEAVDQETTPRPGAKFGELET
jgi:hypothetical protein